MTNCYLVKKQNGKHILVDTGYEWDWKLFRKRLKQIGARLSDISHIILTHHHDDHCGDAVANMLQFAGAKYCVIALGDIDEYYRSWQKIIDKNAKRIFPSHGKPFGADKLINNIGINKKRTCLCINRSPSPLAPVLGEGHCIHKSG